MVAKGSLGRYTPQKPSDMQYWTLVVILVAFSLVGGYTAGIQPAGEWRFFSWHPFLMTSGMVALAGVGAVTKKMGGYANTKMHGILGFASILVSLAGLYCIYENKNRNDFSHLKSSHSKIGLGVFLSSVGLGLAGGVFLHPDFGIDKTNKTIRLAHKTASRLTLMMAWFTAFYGVFSMKAEPVILAGYGLPLLALVPFVLI